MGVMKHFQMQEAEEEMGSSNFSWLQIKTVLKHLIQEFPDTVTWTVQDAIKKREGKGPCEIEWWQIRQMMNNLTEIYYADMDLNDLLGQIEHMSDRHDRLSDKVEEARDSAEFQRLLGKDD